MRRALHQIGRSGGRPRKRRANLAVTKSRGRRMIRQLHEHALSFFDSRWLDQPSQDHLAPRVVQLWA